MKIRLFTLALGLLTTLYFTSCKSTEEASEKKKSSVVKSTREVPAENMVELIRRQSNVYVSGSGNNISIQIRGKRSIMSNNEPLFIVEGQRMGHDFERIANIDPDDVAMVNVITDPATLASYGVGASNGVIEIRLKR